MLRFTACTMHPRGGSPTMGAARREYLRIIAVAKGPSSVLSPFASKFGLSQSVMTGGGGGRLHCAIHVFPQEKKPTRIRQSKSYAYHCKHPIGSVIKAENDLPVGMRLFGKFLFPARWFLLFFCAFANCPLNANCTKNGRRPILVPFSCPNARRRRRGESINKIPFFHFSLLQLLL